MKSVGDTIHFAVKSNIDLAQILYKKDHDKKFCQKKVNTIKWKVFKSVLSPLMLHSHW